MKNQSILIYALTAILLGSCANWKKKERISSPVWSEDNTEIAYILNRYEYKRNYPDGGDVKNEQYSIFLTDEEFSGDFEIYNSFEGFGEELFYMKEAGYIVSGRISDKYHLIDAVTGVLQETFSPKDSKICKDKIGNFQTINVIPSINGSALSVLETRTDCTVDIAFWEADENKRWVEQNIYSVPGNDFDAVAWVDSSNLLLSSCEDFCSEKFYLINTSEGVNEINIVDDFYAPCMFVSTSSSWINKLGEILYIDDESRDLKIASIWDDEEFLTSNQDFSEEYYQPGCDEFD